MLIKAYVQLVASFSPVDNSIYFTTGRLDSSNLVVCLYWPFRAREDRLCISNKALTVETSQYQCDVPNHLLLTIQGRFSDIRYD